MRAPWSQPYDMRECPCPQHQMEQVGEQAEEYRSARPFPHAVIDDFLDSDLAAIVASELQDCDLSTWNHDDHDAQVGKRWMTDPARLPDGVNEALEFMNSPGILAYFSALTGIPDLLPDPTYYGGGASCTSRGGYLAVHTDFNFHPVTGLHRRLNALVFLNPDWQESWEGCLELWDETRPVKAIMPIQNRCAIFTINDTAYHGVPKPVACPPDRRRFSLALYYYTVDRPVEEITPFHWASWR